MQHDIFWRASICSFSTRKLLYSYSINSAWFDYFFDKRVGLEIFENRKPRYCGIKNDLSYDANDLLFCVFCVHISVPGLNLLGSWKVAWRDGDKNAYRIQLKNGAVYMSVLSCTGQGSNTCASKKEVIVTSSTNDQYSGWMQAPNLHGGKVTIYMKSFDSRLNLVWQRPGGYRTTGIGKIMSGK